MVVDTNVVLRFLIPEDKNLTEAATGIFNSGEPLIITDAVLMECAYVMLSSYGKDRLQVQQALSQLILYKNVDYGADLAAQYLELYATTSLDLADCYLIALAIKLKEPLATFDKKMQKVYEKYVQKNCQ